MIRHFLVTLVTAMSLLTLALCPVQAQPSATEASYATTPTNKPDGTPWRIGYVESGEYAEYPRTLRAIAGSLQRLGWLTLDTEIPEGKSGHELWNWLADNTHSTHLEFVKDAWWQPGNFDANQRAPVRAAINERITQQHDIDLMLAMGTWAGQDMRAIGPPVPTIVASTSDPVAAGITDSAQDSGRENLHARVEPDRYQRQVRLFHEIVPFHKLGIVYEDSPEGRTYAALGAVEQVSRELNFSIMACHAVSNSVPTETAIANATDCYAKLAEQGADAVYITSHRGVTKDSITAIARILNHAKIPSFSMAGSQEVKQGVLLSLA